MVYGLRGWSDYSDYSEYSEYSDYSENSDYSDYSDYSDNQEPWIVLFRQRKGIVLFRILQVFEIEIFRNSPFFNIFFAKYPEGEGAFIIS